MIYGLVLAIQFLTRFPINKQVDFSRKNLSKSIFFYPIIGMIIGSFGWIFYFVFSHINENVGAIFSVLALIIATGGLHLDGLSDTCDGFFSCREKEKVLSIMEDSRIGSFGTIAIVMDILMKYVLIANINKNLFIVLALSFGNSRLVVSYIMSTKKIARKNGLGEMFHSSDPKRYALYGGIFYLTLISLINPIYLIPTLITFIVSEIISYVAYKKIDGFTGDVYGATIEICEITSMIAFMGVFLWI